MNGFAGSDDVMEKRKERKRIEKTWKWFQFAEVRTVTSALHAFFVREESTDGMRDDESAIRFNTLDILFDKEEQNEN